MLWTVFKGEMKGKLKRSAGNKEAEGHNPVIIYPLYKAPRDMPTCYLLS